MASTSGPKCLRKAALCYIECRELQKAIEIAQRCPKEEASTSYVMFLAKVHQGKSLCIVHSSANPHPLLSGKESEGQCMTFIPSLVDPEETALQMVETMVAAPDFDRRMLFLATQLAHETKMRHLLLTILQSLLETLQDDYTRDASFEAKSVEGITLIRFVTTCYETSVQSPTHSAKLYHPTHYRNAEGDGSQCVRSLSVQMPRN
jgi:hypothetical protein